VQALVQRLRVNHRMERGGRLIGLVEVQGEVGVGECGDDSATRGGDRAKDEMRRILGEIQSGEFAREWIGEDDAGRPNFTKWREQGAAHPIEDVGKKLRGMMSWVDRPITETA